MTDLTSLSYGAYALVFVAGFSAIMFGLISAVEQTYRKLAPRRSGSFSHRVRALVGRSGIDRPAPPGR